MAPRRARWPASTTSANTTRSTLPRSSANTLMVEKMANTITTQPPRGVGGWVVMVLAIFSTMSVFALERGNVDLVVFALVVLAGHLARRGAIVRGLGYAVIVFAALLKYYPIVALIVALRERPRRVLTVAFWTGAILVLFAIHYRQGLTEGMALVPVGSYYTDFFGAKNLPFGLAGLLQPITAWPGGMLILEILPWLVLAALLWTLGVTAVAGLGSRARPRP